jgi:hypothetical protein
MYTVVYDPDTHLQPQDVPTSRIVFTNMSTSRLGAMIVPPQGPRTSRVLVTTHAHATSLPEAPFWKIAKNKEMTSIHQRGAERYGVRSASQGCSYHHRVHVRLQDQVMNPDGTIEKFKVRLLVAFGNHQKYGETFYL